MDTGYKPNSECWHGPKLSDKEERLVIKLLHNLKNQSLSKFLSKF